MSDVNAAYKQFLKKNRKKDAPILIHQGKINRKDVTKKFLLDYFPEIDNRSHKKYKNIPGYKSEITNQYYSLDISKLVKIIQEQHEMIQKLEKKLNIIEETLKYAPGGIIAEELRKEFEST